MSDETSRKARPGTITVHFSRGRIMPTSITIIGRRWFNRGPGNTYHSAEILVDGQQVGRIDFAYGYGDQYAFNSRQWLAKNGFLPGIAEKDGTPVESLWRYCERHGINYSETVSDVKHKRDL